MLINYVGLKLMWMRKYLNLHSIFIWEKLFILMRPKFQKRSALKFDGRIITEAKPCGINSGLIPRLLGHQFLWITRCLRRGCSFLNESQDISQGSAQINDNV